MNDIIIFVPHDIESELIKKSADLFRMHQIDNNTQNIIIVKKEKLDKMPITTISETTIAELAVQLVDPTVQEVKTLGQQLAQEYVIPPTVHDMPSIALDDTKKDWYNKSFENVLTKLNKITNKFFLIEQNINKRMKYAKCDNTI